MSRSHRLQAVAQAVLGAAMVGAGTGHLTFLRREFQAQVPSWFPADPDLVVLTSGVVEVVLGIAMLTGWRQPARRRVGLTLAAFYVVIFPGNIAQFVEHRDAFGLDTDADRFIRLFFQPLLVVWAWWSTRPPRTTRNR